MIQLRTKKVKTVEQLIKLALALSELYQFNTEQLQIVLDWKTNEYKLYLQPNLYEGKAQSLVSFISGFEANLTTKSLNDIFR